MPDEIAIWVIPLSKCDWRVNSMILQKINELNLVDKSNKIQILAAPRLMFEIITKKIEHLKKKQLILATTKQRLKLKPQTQRVQKNKQDSYRTLGNRRP